MSDKPQDEWFDPGEAIRKINAAMPALQPKPTRSDLALDSVLALRPQFSHHHGECFMTVRDPLSNLLKRMRLRSGESRAFIRRCNQAAHPRVVHTPTGAIEHSVTLSDGVVKAVEGSLEERALRGLSVMPALRVGRTRDAEWFDPIDPHGRVVRMTGKGRRLVSGCPILFLQQEGMMPAAIPAPPMRCGNVAGEVAELFGLDGDQFMTLVCFMLDALRPGRNHMVLVVHGPAGAGKTMLCGFIRAVIDPHHVAVTALPQTERDLAVLADHASMLCFDNVSEVSEEQSDWLCRLTTGFHYTTRRLTTDREATMFAWSGAVVLSGIPALVGRSDLASRAFLLHLNEREEIVEEAQLERRIRGLAGRFLGYLLDGVVLALGRSVSSTARSRLADSQARAMAAAHAYGWSQDDVAELFARQLRHALALLGDNDPVAARVLDWLPRENGLTWPADNFDGSERHGFVGDLHDVLTRRSELYARDWPHTLSAFKARLRRAAPGLAAVGVRLTWQASGRRVRLSMKRRESQSG